ncbi:MAG: hypothetical protein M0R66_00340 [Candidatus Omnitrophica bacterium]|nr:hypothetical protein [Candidatus Omnitrophota bacterium]
MIKRARVAIGQCSHARAHLKARKSMREARARKRRRAMMMRSKAKRPQCDRNGAPNIIRATRNAGALEARVAARLVAPQPSRLRTRARWRPVAGRRM